jgi:endoglucanase
MKKTISILLTFALLFSLAVTVPVYAEQALTAQDALIVLQASVGAITLTSAQMTRYNLTGTPTTANALEILRLSVGLGQPAQPPVEEPTPPVQEPPVAQPPPASVNGTPFSTMTAAQVVADIGIGWNLGNTLDSSGDWLGANPSVSRVESAWGNPVTTKANIDAIKNAGFNAIRIPVTWHTFVDKDNNINPSWMARVKQIVDWAIANDMYVILNTHHDNPLFKFQNVDMPETTVVFTRVWEQIAATFRDYDHRLIFLSLNEPRTYDTPNQWTGGTPEERTNLNTLNQIFVDTVRASGGNNVHRILMVPTYAAGATTPALNDFRVPNDPLNSVNKIVMSVHTYSPFAWAHDGRGVYDANGLTTIRRDLDRVQGRANALGVPVILGEWGSIAACDLRQRAQHAEDYVREARARGMATFWWDNGGFGTDQNGHGFGIYDRRNNTFPFPSIIEAMLRGLGN